MCANARSIIAKTQPRCRTRTDVGKRPVRSGICANCRPAQAAAADASAVSWPVAELSEVWCTAASSSEPYQGAKSARNRASGTRICPSFTSEPIGAELLGQWACSWRLRVRKRTSVGQSDTKRQERHLLNRRQNGQKRCRVIRTFCEYPSGDGSLNQGRCAMRSFSGLKTGIFRAASALGVVAITGSALVHAQWTITQLTDNGYNDVAVRKSPAPTWCGKAPTIRGDLPLRHHNRLDHATDRQSYAETIARKSPART